MRAIILGTIATFLSLAGTSLADEVGTDCCQPPPCGKVCKLVCETEKLTAVGYGYECDTICIPGPSRPGCTHCDTTCCCGDDIQGCPPKIEFCWRDWFASGCAKPRTVKVLTKYQAEKEIASYHWEVVDAACCGPVSQRGDSPPRPFYKPAPPEAELGEVLPIADEEWAELASFVTPGKEESEHDVATNSATSPPVDPNAPATNLKSVSIAERLRRLFTR